MREFTQMYTYECVRVNLHLIWDYTQHIQIYTFVYDRIHMYMNAMMCIIIYIHFISHSYVYILCIIIYIHVYYHIYTFVYYHIYTFHEFENVVYHHMMTHKCIYMIIHQMYTYECEITLHARLHLKHSNMYICLWSHSYVYACNDIYDNTQNAYVYICRRKCIWIHLSHSYVYACDDTYVW